MNATLWKFDELLAAAGATAEGAAASPIAGFSIDTRSLVPGEVFVALKDQRDGHDYVTTAFRAGAAAALVSHGYQRTDGDGALLRSDDPMRALERIARAARARLSPASRVFAVTGSAGKTTVKDMMRAGARVLGPTHASDRSFNNHWGVPLTLARMPASTAFAIFEIGMNHAGEITPLVGMVRPHVAIVTTVAPAHLANFDNEEGIADAKAEIFTGLEPAGTAIVNLDNRHAPRLVDAARRSGARVVGVTGQDAHRSTLGAVTVDGVVALRSIRLHDQGSEVTVMLAGNDRDIRFTIGVPGHHMVMNALCAAAAFEAAGVDAGTAMQALATFAPPSGRGSRLVLAVPGGKILVVDESYNANPASMRAALSVLGQIDRSLHPRRIAVLGDMLELGAQADEMHAALYEAVEAAGVDLVFAAGAHMAHLFDRVPAKKRGAWAPTAKDIEAALLDAMGPGDVVMVKGSHGSRMGGLIQAIQARFGGTA